MRRIVTPCSALSRRKVATMMSVSVGRRPAITSSSNSSCGSHANARATSRRLRSGSVSDEAGRARRDHMSRSRSARSAREWASRRSGVPRKPPTITFSSTDMSAKGLTTWKVRPIPTAHTWSARQPAMSVPRKRMRPWSGGMTPATRLNKVVLPAPLGPISATISPRATDSDAESTARKPRKLFETPSTSSRVASRSVITIVPLAREAQAARDARPDTMGHEHDRCAQGDAVEDLLHAGDLVAGEFERRVDPLGAQGGARRAQPRPERRTDPADDRREDHLDGPADMEDLLGKEIVVVEGEEHACQRGHAGRDLHREHLVPEHIDTGRARRFLVVADRPEIEAEASAQQPRRQQEAPRRQAQRQAIKHDQMAAQDP